MSKIHDVRMKVRGELEAPPGLRVLAAAGELATFHLLDIPERLSGKILSAENRQGATFKPHKEYVEDVSTWIAGGAAGVAGYRSRAVYLFNKR